MLSGRSTYKTTAPAAPLIDYNTGRLEPRAIVWIFGIAAVGLLVLFVPGGALMILCQPPAYGDWGAWRILGFVAGGALAVLGVMVFWWPVSELRAERRAFRARQDESFETDIELRRQQGGVIVEEASNEWELRADKPDEVWWFITAMHRAVQGGHDAPWALRRVTDEGVWVGHRKIAINTNQARLMVDNLATMGLIRGRTERHPGQWVPETLDDAAELFDKNGTKVL
jgi:hypothetical protein